MIFGTGARRRGSDYTLPPASEIAPYAPAVLCSLPAYTNGNQNTIHPSVHDFGAAWNGYRWWMANTPYPPDQDENPCIYASNDQVNWEAPPGLTNPIDPWPGQSTSNTDWYNSDTELVIDDSGNLVCIYREFQSGTVHIRARTSADGVAWGPEHALISSPDLLLSPSAVRMGPADFRMWMIGGGGVSGFSATHPLGPWVWAGGSSLGVPAHHGDVMRWGDSLLIAVSDGATGGIRCGHSSTGGSSWTMPSAETIAAGVVSAYRPTLAPSPKPGWVDVWIGGWAESGARTAYTRVPLGAFGL